MAQLKDTVVSGSLRATDTIIANSFSGPLTGNAATASQLKGYLEGVPALTTAPATGSIRYSYHINTATTGLFNSINNANGILTLNKHDGNYDSQLGFSSNGNLYYRNFNGSALNTTTTWKQIAFTDSDISGGIIYNGTTYMIPCGRNDYVSNARIWGITLPTNPNNVNANNTMELIVDNNNISLYDRTNSTTVWQIPSIVYSTDTPSSPTEGMIWLKPI